MRRRGHDRYTPAQARTGKGDTLPTFAHQLANLHADSLSALWNHLAATSGLNGVDMSGMIPSKGEIQRQLRREFASVLRGDP